MKNFQKAVNSSKSLKELCEIMNELSQYQASTDADRSNDVDASSLPNFGGKDIEHTDGIFSWDANSVLVQSSEWAIEEREGAE